MEENNFNENIESKQFEEDVTNKKNEIPSNKSAKKTGIIILVIILLWGVFGVSYYYLSKDNSSSKANNQALKKGNTNLNENDKPAGSLNDNSAKKYKDTSEAIKNLENSGYYKLEDEPFTYLDNSVGTNYIPTSALKYNKNNIPEDVKDYITFNGDVLTVDVSGSSFDNNTRDSLSGVNRFSVNSDFDNGLFIDIFAYTNNGSIYRIYINGFSEENSKFNLLSSNNEYTDVVATYDSDECIANSVYQYYLKGNDNYKLVCFDDECSSYTIPIKAISNAKYFVNPVSILDNGFFIQNKEYKETVKYAVYDVDTISFNYLITTDNKLIDVNENKVLTTNIDTIMIKKSKASCSILDAYNMVVVDKDSKTFSVGERVNLLK